MATNYESLKASLLESGSLFEDEDFPAEQSSIFYVEEDGMPNSWTTAEWKRPSEICENPQFFVDGTSKFDLDQGAIGNCWFLSAASVLTTKPELFDQVVPPNQTFTDQYAGIFKFNFWRFGEWREVVIDDRLPTRNGKLLFCKNRDQTNEFWAALMEKAYAKIHGSYQSLETGYSHDALVDFTGGIGEFITIKDYAENSGRLFKLLLRTFKMNSLVCCNIGEKKGSEGKTEEKLDTGLVSTHAYSVTSVVKFTNGDVTVRLIRCLNPWGYREWTGAWSDGSDEWNSVTDDQKQHLNLTTANDGEFWMSFEDFMANFHEIQICHLSPESISRALGGKKKEWNMAVHHGQWISGVNAGGCGAPPHQAEYWANPQYFVKLTDTDETDDVDTCTVIISLMQKFRRQMKTSMKKTENMEEAVGFDVLKFKGETPEELDGQSFDASQLRIERKMTKFEYFRERSGRYDLSPGTYCVIPVTFKPDTEAEFMLRVATEKPIDSGEIDSGSKPVQETSGGGGGKKRKFDRLFGRFAGDDNVVDAKELKRILNKGYKQEDDEGFSKETSRALVNMYGQESKGLLSKKECKLAWQRVRDLQNSFEEFDADDSGLLSRRELKTAFQNTGFGLSKKSVAFIATHFCGKEGGLGFDDFALVSVKSQTLYDRFQRLARKEGSETVSGMTFDEWLEATL